MVFFDNAGTTKVDIECLEILKHYCFENFYNPSALYHKSVKVNNHIKTARNKVLSILNGDGRFVFTSSGTESDNLALFGARKRKGSRIIISGSEHPAIINAAMELKQQGYDVVITEVDMCGRVIFDDFKKHVNANTAFISVMHVNNELGGINDIKMLVDYAKSVNENIVFHSDGVQALGKIPINLNELGVDMYSVSGHKIHSVKGCGGLFVKKGIHIKPILYGGGQEDSIRSSTENVPAIMCFCHMLEKQVDSLDKNYHRIVMLKDYLCENIDCDKAILLSDNNCVPHIVGVTLKDVRGEVMLHSLEKHGIMIGTGSACNSSKSSESGWKNKYLPKQYKKGIIRLSFCRDNKIEELEYFKNMLNLEYSNLVKYTKG